MSKMEELSTVHVVVNHLHLREALTEPTVRAAEARA
jgi:hypothetical protein